MIDEFEGRNVSNICWIYSVEILLTCCVIGKETAITFNFEKDSKL